LSWPLPPDLDDDGLEATLFSPEEKESPAKRQMPDMEYIRGELTRKSVTLRLLWLPWFCPLMTWIFPN